MIARLICKPSIPVCIVTRIALAATAIFAVACESVDQNVAGTPAKTITAAAQCKDGLDCGAPDNSCYVAVCTSGQCAAKLAVDGTPCNDGDICNGADKCAAGTCVAGETALVCDDKDTCTVDSCSSKVGCVFNQFGSKCEDNEPCTDDTCVKNACKNVNNDTNGCDDGDDCTVGDKCTAGKCKAGTGKVCDDNNICTTDSCDGELGCIGKNNSAPCTDNNACTKGDECLDGECRVGKSAVGCDDGNACTDDSCDKIKGCVNAAQAGGKPCSDGDACTDTDTCKSGKCAAGSPLACNDSDLCTDDACDKTKGCTHSANTVKCEDGDVCSEGDACASGKCVAGKAKNCDDANVCSVDSCDPKLGCQLAASASACDDLNPCSVGDGCKDKACVAGSGKPDCDDKNPCTDDACDPKSGCTHTNTIAVCDDNDAKTSGDVCALGVCAGKLASDPTPTCAAYCQAVNLACGTTGTNAQYATVGECTSWCEDLAMFAPGTAADKAGNTIGCRTYHATVAKVDPVAAAAHCPHAGKTGGNICGTWCENYCAVALMNCNAALSYKNMGDCMSTCNKAPVNSTVADTSGYSVQCMIVQGGLSFNDPTLCMSLSVTDGGVAKCKAPPQPKTEKVGTSNFAFVPAALQISVGDSVEFKLEGFHNALEVDQATWDADGVVAKTGGFLVEFGGAAKVVKFSAAGTYYYVCEPHVASSKMKGKVTVK